MGQIFPHQVISLMEGILMDISLKSYGVNIYHVLQGREHFLSVYVVHVRPFRLKGNDVKNNFLCWIKLF